MAVCLAASKSIPPVHPMDDAHVDAAKSSVKRTYRHLSARDHTV